ncbi:hypothetical protein MLD38_040520 [Melastoma candidum]|nr:hypothetical protein MLD38_040520 [Melastoma candidum]
MVRCSRDAGCAGSPNLYKGFPPSFGRAAMMERAVVPRQQDVCLTYLTQRLEYRFHTARVIGSNPIVGEDQEGRKAQRETFHCATRFFREALSQTFPLLPPQGFKIPGHQVKVNSPEQIF